MSTPRTPTSTSKQKSVPSSVSTPLTTPQTPQGGKRHRGSEAQLLIDTNMADLKKLKLVKEQRTLPATPVVTKSKKQAKKESAEEDQTVTFHSAQEGNFLILHLQIIYSQIEKIAQN